MTIATEQTTDSPGNIPAYRIRTVTQSRASGLDALRFGRLPPAGDNKTVVVLGAPRSGTSMVAGVLRIMGVYMGKDLDDKHEDQNFAFSRDSHGKPVSFYRALSRLFRVKKTIDSRNANYALWGWKEPLSIILLEIISRFLRNPHYIVIMRNPLASALSAEHHAGRPAHQTIKTTLGKCRQLTDFISRNNRPALTVSYESAIKHPRQFCLALSEFLGLAITQQQLLTAEQFIAPDQGYQEIITDPYMGYLENFENHILRGWAINFEHKTPIKVQIFTGQRLIAETYADMPRPDVANTYGQDYLRSGFCLQLDKARLLNGNLRVVYADTDEDLRNSPLKVA